MSSSGGVTFLIGDTIMASGRNPEKLSLPTLQTRMKIDPEGYETELHLLYKQFNSYLELFKQQAALNFNSLSGIGADNTVAKDLSVRAMFLAHVVPYYPQHLSLFPNQLAEFLRTSARSLPSLLRRDIVQALKLLMNEAVIEEMLPLFVELQTLADKKLREMGFNHVVDSIKCINQKHKDEAKDRALQRILCRMLQRDDESIAKTSLNVLCNLHRRRVWYDEKISNAICMACLHPSPKIMKAALCFLLDRGKIVDSSSEDEATPQNPQITVSREDAYKAHKKGTRSSKKKKIAKLERRTRNVRKQQRLSSEKTYSSCYSPLNHLKDAQPHQRDVMNILAAAVQACHDMVPPDAVEPLFKQIVNQFVNDRSRPEAIAVGLNVVEEVCRRMPLLMTEELLQDLALYRKEKEKAVSCAARSLLSLCREICPSLLIKRDRGLQINPTARLKAFGEVNVATNVSGIELLQDNADDSDEDKDEDDDTEIQDLAASGSDEEDEGIDLDHDSDFDTVFSQSGDEELGVSDNDEDEDGDGNSMSDVDVGDDEDGLQETKKQSNSKKRKLSDFKGQLNVSLRNLKKLASTKSGNGQTDSGDGILSNEEFERVKQLKAKAALLHHGLMKKGSDSKSGAIKIPTADLLTLKLVDPSLLEARMHKKMTKDERMELVKAGREDRGRYRSKTAVKQRKTIRRSTRSSCLLQRKGPRFPDFDWIRRGNKTMQVSSFVERKHGNDSKFPSQSG